MSSFVSRAAAIFFFAASAHAQTSPQLVAKVDAHYANVRTYNHAFTQTLTLRAYNQVKSQSGTMSLARPSQMSFVYSNGDRFTVSGTTVTAVTNGQTMTQQISQTLAASFTFVQPPTPFQGGFILVGTPIQPMGQYTKALFYVDSQTSDVRRITLIDAQRNTNTFDL